MFRRLPQNVRSAFCSRFNPLNRGRGVQTTQDSARAGQHRPVSILSIEAGV